MRILFTCSPLPGHLNPILGFAMAARDNGHDVVVATADSLSDRIAALGLAPRPAGVDASDTDVMAILSGVPHTDPGKPARLFGTFADKAFEEIEQIISSFEPHLVFSEAAEMVGPVLAEKAGIRRAVFGFMGSLPTRAIGDMLDPALQNIRDRAGLEGNAFEALQEAEWVFGGLPRFAPPEARPPKNVHYCRPRSEGRHALENAPPWANAMRGKRTVYMTLGTAGGALRPGGMETIVAGLAKAQLDGVVATTGPRDPSTLGTLPDSFRVAQYIPQSYVLPNVAAAVLHAGYGSTTEAILHGLPLVLIPFGADQPANAQCCERLGIGVCLKPDEMTPESVRDALHQVLADPRYAERSKAVADELAALPSPEDVVESLLSRRSEGFVL